MNVSDDLIVDLDSLVDVERRGTGENETRYY